MVYGYLWGAPLFFIDGMRQAADATASCDPNGSMPGGRRGLAAGIFWGLWRFLG